MPVNRNAVIAGLSNLSTAYNLVVINIVHVIVQNQYCGGDNCTEAVGVASTSCLVGAIVGQLTFGFVGDCLGRPRALQLTMFLSVCGALVSAFAVPLVPSDPSSIFHFIAIARFFLGIGVGGVYPLSATIAQESSGSAAERGRTASLVFSMQGVGNLIVPLIALALVQLPGGNPADCSQPGSKCALGLSWRLALGLGALPGILLAPFKASGSTTEPLSKPDNNSSNDAVGSGAEPPSALTLGQALRMRKYWGKLLGTAGGWLLFDITFYGNQLFQARPNARSAPLPRRSLPFYLALPARTRHRSLRGRVALPASTSQRPARCFELAARSLLLAASNLLRAPFLRRRPFLP